jgi:hypothetical protein
MKKKSILSQVQPCCKQGMSDSLKWNDHMIDLMTIICLV